MPLPESGPGLGNPDLNLRDEHFRVETPFDFGGVRAFEEQTKGLDEVRPSFLHGRTLTGTSYSGHSAE